MAEPYHVAEKALQKLADQLTCAICLESYTNPKVLPCLHVFCENCLGRLVLCNAENMTIACPNCRQEARLPQGSVADLPCAFYINHLFEVRDTLQKVKNPNKTMCEKCEEGEAKGYCRNCGQFVCQICIGIHGKWKEFIGHEIATLGQIEADVAQLVMPKKVTMKCSKHPSKELKIYCETCDELICRDCTVKTHRDHQFDLVSECFPKLQDSIVASLEPIKHQLCTVNQAVAEVDARSTQIAENGATIKHNIHTAIDQLHEALEIRKQQLMVQVDRMVGQTSKSLAAQRDRYQLTQTQLASCLEFVEESLRTGSPQEVLSMRKQVVERAQQMTKEFQPNHYQLEPEETVYFYHEQLLNVCSRFGEAVLLPISPEKCYATGEGVERAIPGEIATFTLRIAENKCTGATPYIPVTAELVPHGDGTTVKCQLSRKEDDNYELTYQPQFHGQHDLHVKVYGRPIRNSPFTVAVMKAVPDFLGTHEKTISGAVFPRQLAVTRDEHIVVVEMNANCVSVFDHDGRKLRSFGNQGSQQSSLVFPSGVALCSDNSVLVAAEHCVKKYSLDGTFIAAVGKGGSGNLEFNTPSALATNDKSKRIYVCDTGNNRIQVLNEDLTHHSSVGSYGSDPGQFQEPKDLATDSSGKLFVADYGNHRIQVFSCHPEEQFLYQFKERETGIERLQGPIGVSIDADGFVYVLEYDVCRVSIFNYKGIFVQSFGKVGGDKTWEFSRPRGLTVDLKGYVYVSDSGNHHIEIFK